MLNIKYVFEYCLQYSVPFFVHFVCMFDFLPSSSQHMSNDECLEDNREDYHNCSVLSYKSCLYS